MRKILIGASLAAMAAVASPAAAETSLGSVCGQSSGGGMMGCASAAVSLSGNTLTVSVANLNGVSGDAYRLTSFGIYAPASAGYGTSTLTTTTTGSVSWSNGVSNDLENPGPGGMYAWLAGANAGGGNNGIFGCTNTGGGSAVSSCNGPLSFNFTLAANSTLTESDLGSLQFTFRGKAFGDGSSLKCYTSNPSNAPACDPITVTPEPATLALLAGGLFGLGGVGFLRRRRGQLDA